VEGIALPKGGAGWTAPGQAAVDLLASVGITPSTIGAVEAVLKKAQGLLEAKAAESQYEMGSVASSRHKHTSKLGTLGEFLSLVVGSAQVSQFSGQPIHAEYRVHVGETQPRRGKGFHSQPDRTYNFWCFRPGLAMQEIAKLPLTSIILTSGTLSPMSSFAHELQVPFPVRLENPHVIEPSQVWVGAIPTGPSGATLNSSFNNRKNPLYFQDLGNAVANFARVVPDGMLVFFTSFSVMNDCLDSWRVQWQKGVPPIWDRIARHKHTVVEPRDAKQLDEVQQEFERKLDDKSHGGCIFFAVCRGKVSEGLDFSDRAGRAVVLTGIPYPMVMDPKVRIKKQVLDDSFRKNRQGLRGDEWYTQQGTRAANQALGRVIRHRNDFGAIILCDDRYTAPNADKGLSSWIRPGLQKFDRFGKAAASLAQFFRAQKERAPAAAKKPAPRLAPRIRGSEARPAVAQSRQAIDTSGIVRLASGLAGKTPAADVPARGTLLQRLEALSQAGSAKAANQKKGGVLQMLEQNREGQMVPAVPAHSSRPWGAQRPATAPAARPRAGQAGPLPSADLEFVKVAKRLMSKETMAQLARCIKEYREGRKGYNEMLDAIFGMCNAQRHAGLLELLGSSVLANHGEGHRREFVERLDKFKRARTK